VTNVMEAFSMVEQREMTPQDWVRLSKEEKAAYSEFKEDADREAAQTEELPEADDGRAISFMAEERLSEVQMPGEGNCAFGAVCAMLPKSSKWNPGSLRRAVVDELLRDEVVSLEYASVMRQEGTWATDVEMMRAAQMVRRLIVMVVMRPRVTPGGVQQEVIQVFEPAVHDAIARMVVVNRPGHFNATAVREWKLNERGRRTLRRITGIVVSAGLRAAASFGLSQWGQEMDREQREKGRLMAYKGWEVELSGWNGGVAVAGFWPSARRLEELREEAEARRESSAVKMEEHAQAAGERHAEEKRQATVELRTALERAEPGGLTIGCSEFGAEFFRQTGGCGKQRDEGCSADAGEMGADARQCEQRSAAAALREALFVVDGRARAAQELRVSLDSAEAAIDRGGVYVARSVQELRCALQENEQGVMEATEGQQREDAAESRRNEIREKMSWQMGADAVDTRA